ncbi:hypothetical protein GGS23DRAFT_565908 [Durotheca rogersii]|uniref:uncharacterized protein n=1 Tax=Durotheca rogersii TaxID=419775 RepID=UPI00221E8AFB|nr:uncharacterized protein GGS23DRAFT_565908 [Durotheca rogersii]KAI5863901.1 hypothetical protein GGS23DRAFT_565908 [Durotheca rogersii]
MAARSAIALVQRSKAAGPEILQLRCHVRPGASKAREGVAAVTDDAVELCVAAPPQDGKANKAVLQLLSEVLGVAKSDLQITHGTKSRDKTISVASSCFLSGRGPARSGDDLVALVRERLLGQQQEDAAS